jgi:hypothetical protein
MTPPRKWCLSWSGPIFRHRWSRSQGRDFATLDFKARAGHHKSYVKSTTSPPEVADHEELSRRAALVRLGLVSFQKRQAHMMLGRTTWSACTALLLLAAGGGCEFITAVDRSAMTGAGGSTGDGSAIGSGGSSGSAGTDIDASVAMETGASGAGGDMLGAGGAGGTSAGGGGGGTTVTPNDSGTRDAEGGAGGDGSVCGGTVPAGWTLTVYSPSATPCPAGFTGDHPIIGTPTLQPGACTCSCVPGQQPSCTQGTLVAAINDACVTPWLTGTTVNGTGCITADGQDFDNASAAPLPPQPGTCTTGSTANQAQLTKPPQHYCDVPSASVANVCAGNVPAGYDACITIANATATCPSPFTRLFRVQDDATVSCGTCTACSFTASCSNQTVTLYSDTACGAELDTFLANNTCQSTNPDETPVNSIRYTATATPICNAGNSTPSTVVVGPRTICCR